MADDGQFSRTLLLALDAWRYGARDDQQQRELQRALSTAVREAAERSGLDVRQVAAVLSAGSPGSPLVKIVAQRMLDRAYEPNFFVPLMAKDLAYAGAAFARAGLELRSAEVAREAFLAAERAGFGEKDIASIVELLRR